MAVRSTRTEAKVCTPLCEHEVGRRLRMTCCGCLMPCHVQHRLCWVGGVDAGSCWGAACCASRDIAARAVRACGRHPRAHAQLRSICGRWWQRRTATATRSLALGTKLEAWRTFCDACDARLPAGLPVRQRRRRPVSAPQHARRPGVLHLDCHVRHMHVMRGAALATMADPERDAAAAAAVGAQALLIALACPWGQLPTARPRLRRPLGGAHGAGACDLLHGRACRLL